MSIHFYEKVKIHKKYTNTDPSKVKKADEELYELLKLEYDEFKKYRDLMGVSIGISLCEENGLTFEELYSAADAALSAAAREGRNIYRFS